MEDTPTGWRASALLLFGDEVVLRVRQVLRVRRLGVRRQNAWGSRGRRESPPGVIEEPPRGQSGQRFELTKETPGGMPERPKGADCKSAGSRLRRFESFSLHHSTHGDRTAGIAQLVERQPSKLNVTGSNPVSRSNGGAASAGDGRSREA